MAGIRRILCPIDFSDGAEHAFREAVRIAAWHRAEIHAIHVLPILPEMWAVPPASDPVTRELIPPTDFTLDLETLVAPAHEAGLAVEVHSLQGGVAAEIVAYAEAHEVDL